MKKSILEENKSYTFSDYFKLPYPTRDIVAEFGYEFRFEKIELPKKEMDHLNLERLRTVFYKKLRHVSLNSETAKREFFVSPLLLELLDYIEIDIDVEYPVNVNERLKGNIDYIIHSSKNLIVVEAKNAEIDKGFTQLAVELIAMESYLENHNDLLYGAITMGDWWRFGVLDRKNKIIFKDIDAFLIPADMEKLFSVLFGILE
jgi:hypothetical protein